MVIIFFFNWRNHSYQVLKKACESGEEEKIFQSKRRNNFYSQLIDNTQYYAFTWPTLSERGAKIQAIQRDAVTLPYGRRSTFFVLSIDTVLT